jgi:hypothetical protein
VSDYPNDNLFQGATTGIDDDYRRLADEEWDEHLRLRRAGELPVPSSSTGLCKACGANVALPAGLLCEACSREVFACEPCECGGVCERCAA